jgi:hypothetical protein
MVEWFVFGRSQIKISAWELAIMAKVVRGFSQFFEANARIVL